VPALKRRNRIVVFRLTQEEYASLKSACVDRGARNISDFARAALLSSIESESGGALGQRLSELESSMRQISALLERIASQK
jgi:hypothetical protein